MTQSFNTGIKTECPKCGELGFICENSSIGTLKVYCNDCQKSFKITEKQFLLWAESMSKNSGIPVELVISRRQKFIEDRKIRISLKNN